MTGLRDVRTPRCWGSTCRTTWSPTPIGDEVIANISALVDKARAEHVPVIWVQHADDNTPEGSDGWQYVPELQRHEAEALVHKHYGDAFEATERRREADQKRVVDSLDSFFRPREGGITVVGLATTDGPRIQCIC